MDSYADGPCRCCYVNPESRVVQYPWYTVADDNDDGTDLSQVGASRSYSDIHEVSYALADPDR